MILLPLIVVQDKNKYYYNSYDHYYDFDMVSHSILIEMLLQLILLPLLQLLVVVVVLVLVVVVVVFFFKQRRIHIFT